MIILHLSNGQEKRLAPTELLYAGGRMKRADQIEVGDVLEGEGFRAEVITIGETPPDQAMREAGAAMLPGFE